jgi:hypothetical protein
MFVKKNYIFFLKISLPLKLSPGRVLQRSGPTKYKNEH